MVLNPALDPPSLLRGSECTREASGSIPEESSVEELGCVVGSRPFPSVSDTGCLPVWCHGLFRGVRLGSRRPWGCGPWSVRSLVTVSLPNDPQSSGFVSDCHPGPWYVTVSHL